MKEFDELRVSLDLVGKDLVDFRLLLDSKKNLTERGDILPFFRSHRQLAAFAGWYHPGIVLPNRLLAFEYPLFGDFAADLVIGDGSKSSFCFIEFEDALPESIFKKTSRSLPAWSDRFLGGFGQIIDWLWKLSEFEHTPEFRRTYGNGPVDFEGLLVIGRTADLDEREHHRLQWLTRNCVVDSKHIRCITLDDSTTISKDGMKLSQQ